MVKVTHRLRVALWLCPLVVLMASCGDGVGPEVEAAQRDASAADSETAEANDKIRDAEAELESIREQISETEREIEASRAAIAYVNRANAVLATQQALRSVPTTTAPPPTSVPPPLPPPAPAPPDTSAFAEVACEHFRNVVDDAEQGLLSEAALEAKVGEIYDKGRYATEPEVAQGSADLFAAVNRGDANGFVVAMVVMQDACARYGL